MMIKLNNKGQSLVMFVLIIPIIILVFFLVVDIGNAIRMKNELNNVCYLVMDYAISNNYDNSMNDKIIDLIKRNLDDVSFIGINFENDVINITVKRRIKGIISDKLTVTEVISSYNGYVKENKKVIERV